MKQQTIIILIIIWLASNIALPLIIRSLDRICGEKIDKILNQLFALIKYSVLVLFRIILIIFLLPLIIIVEFFSFLNIKWAIKLFQYIRLIDFISNLFSKSFSFKFLWNIILSNPNIK